MMPSATVAEALPRQLFAVAAQLLEINDRDATIFEPQQTFLLQRLQALVGFLPGDAGQRPDLLLGDLQVGRQVGIENGIEQRRNAARQARGDIQRAAVFEQPYELAKTLVELSYQKAIEPYAVLEQP